MNEGHDCYMIRFNAVDESIPAYENLSVYRVVEFRNEPAPVGQVGQRSRGLESILDELARRRR
jgi:hypothetical protein